MTSSPTRCVFGEFEEKKSLAAGFGWQTRDLYTAIV